jgi:hypothetical protein
MRYRGMRVVWGVILTVLMVFALANARTVAAEARSRADETLRVGTRAVLEEDEPAGRVTAEDVSAAAGIVLSLAFSYVPGLHAKWDPLEPTWKRLIMAGLLAVVSLAVWGLACYEIFGGVACTKAGAIELGRVFIVALIANQAAYMLSPQTPRASPPGRREFTIIGGD